VPEEKNTNFDGEIVLVNSFDTQDSISIHITLATPQNADGFFMRYLNNHALFYALFDVFFDLESFI